MSFFLSAVHLELILNLLETDRFTVPHGNQIIHGQDDIDCMPIDALFFNLELPSVMPYRHRLHNTL